MSTRHFHWTTTDWGHVWSLLPEGADWILNAQPIVGREPLTASITTVEQHLLEGHQGKAQLPRRLVDIIPIEPDGNCMFAALSVSYLCFTKTKKKEVPAAETIRNWGSKLRAVYLADLSLKLASNWKFPGDNMPPLALLLGFCTEMNVSQYLELMPTWGVSISQWGGYFEILLLAFKLQRRVYVFIDTGGKNDFIHAMTAGHDFVYAPPCVLLWQGTHYDCLKMKADEDPPGVQQSLAGTRGGHGHPGNFGGVAGGGATRQQCGHCGWRMCTRADATRQHCGRCGWRLCTVPKPGHRRHKCSVHKLSWTPY
jgi:hypothetical protein